MTSPRPAPLRAMLAAFFVLTLAAPSALADARAEAAAKEALAKAQTDYQSGNYTAAADRLKQALHGCAAPHCGASTRATLLRDIGTMEFRAGDKTAASKSFDDALALDPNVTLDPNYDASDVGAAFEDSRAAAGLPAGNVSTKPPPGGAATAPSGPAPGAEGGEQPSGGDFVHQPAHEQRENTPLPIYVEYRGGAQLARVVVKYKGQQMRDWQRVELSRQGKGWGGLIPCGDVTAGVVHYWIQGFDRSGQPVAAGGDAKHAYFVPIHDKLTGEAPHLPGKAPPRSCDEDCPPGIPGCNKGDTGAAPSDERAPDEEPAPAKKVEPPAGPPPRLWIGASVALDLLVLPSSSNVCLVNPDGTPVNAQHYYCFGFDPAHGSNTNFPSSPMENMRITNGGTAPGGFTLGDVRLTAALDYALSDHVLAGLRFGYAFNSYPGRNAAFPSRLHLEARGTFLLGQAPLTGVAPMLFAGLGASQFDGRTSTHDLAYTGFTGAQSEDVWLSNGPFFVTAGVGGRFALSQRVALTAAARLNLSFGQVGVLPTFGPELGALYGF